MIDRLGQIVRNGAWNSGSTLGVTVTCGGSAHTKGAWAELTAAPLDAPIGAMILSISNPSSIDSFLVDIGYGASTAAVFTAIPNLQFRVATNNGCVQNAWPLYIPAGMRVYARCQSPTASASLELAASFGAGGSLQAPGGGLLVPRKWHAFGPNLATSLCVQTDAGGTANTPGAWATLTHADAADAPNSGRVYKWGAISVHHPTLVSRITFGLEVCWYDGAGATQPITPSRLFFDNYWPFRRVGILTDMPIHLKDVGASAVFRARCQSSTTSPTDRLLAIGLYVAE